MSEDNIRLMSAVACEREEETTRIRHDVFEMAVLTSLTSMGTCDVDMTEDRQTRGWMMAMKDKVHHGVVSHVETVLIFSAPLTQDDEEAVGLQSGTD
jgi:hypothetical protein